MSLTSYIAASRQVSLQHSLDTTALNIASQGVPGHQNTELVFSHYLKNGVSYVDDPAAVRDQTPGAIIQTEDPLHVALNGTGYFAVQDNNGDVYFTRGGAFQLNAERFVVTPQGDQVLDEGLSPLQIPETSEEILIGEDGTIADQESQIARLGVFTFDNLNDMKQGPKGYLKTDQAPQAIEFPKLTQGAYEGSNTNMVLATTQLASIQREYQQNMKFIEIDNEIESQSNQHIVKLASGA